ncbi:hypothetical protein DEW08_09390 [Azospirillum thermophilum]|uniref:DUF1127 domain-containing protein n=1 Tax=Azospirillum thermophilum TaxID=2202148 RepID=A0A2S2CQ36_9PROT|nr:hypothetical protein DEW08_09390 [Azospirillum thermophilum]
MDGMSGMQRRTHLRDGRLPLLVRLMRMPRLWAERRAYRNRLATMDPHLWADIGLDERTVREELGKPFWRP